MPVIVTKIVLYHTFSDASDPLFSMWPVTICMQVTQFLELMAACILYIRPFLEALTSGFINGDDLRRRGQIKPYIALSYGVPTSETAKKSSETAERTPPLPTGVIRVHAADGALYSLNGMLRADSDEDENPTTRGFLEFGMFRNPDEPSPD